MADTTGTALGCRSIFNVDHDPALLTKVREQVFSWSTAKKGWDIADLEDVGIRTVAPGVTASMLAEARQDGSTIERWRFHESHSAGTWVTQLTAVHNRNNSGEVWTDLLAPADQTQPRLPAVVREILGVTTGLDGNSRLTAEPERARADDVEEILGALNDRHRRGYVFIAGSDADSGITFPDWADFATKLLRDTRGLASAYLLDPAATKALNERLPSSHAVSPWTIRTFLSQPDFDDPRDAVRHRIMTMQRLGADSEGNIRRILANAVCRHSTTVALPHNLIRIDRQLRDKFDALIVDRAMPLPTHQTTSIPAPEAASQPTPEPTAVPTPTTSEPAPAPSGIMTALKSVLAQAFGPIEVTTDAVRKLGALVRDSLPRSEHLATVRERMRTVESERSALEDQANALKLIAADSQQESSNLQAALDDSERELRRLRVALAQHGKADDAWRTPAEATGLDRSPETFGELCGRFGEFDNVVFTGDPKDAIELDEHSLLDTWARKTWNALRALDDYAQVRKSGRFVGGVEEYAANTPPGCVALLSHARGETQATQNNSRFGKERTFRVPTTVDPAGRTFMGAHVKIGKYGMVSPRLHYLNDVASSGKIYVGYIGQHKDNFRTS